MEYIIQKINFGEEESGEKDGKTWRATKVGICIDNIWYNSLLSGIHLDLAKELKVGDSIELELSEKPNEKNPEKPYKKFKITGAINTGNEHLLARRLKSLEEDVLKLKRQVSELYDVQNGIIPATSEFKKSNESTTVIDNTNKKSKKNNPIVNEDFIVGDNDDLPF